MPRLPNYSWKPKAMQIVCSPLKKVVKMILSELHVYQASVMTLEWEHSILRRHFCPRTLVCALTSLWSIINLSAELIDCPGIRVSLPDPLSFKFHTSKYGTNVRGDLLAADRQMKLFFPISRSWICRTFYLVGREITKQLIWQTMTKHLTKPSNCT